MSAGVYPFVSSSGGGLLPSAIASAFNFGPVQNKVIVATTGNLTRNLNASSYTIPNGVTVGVAGYSIVVNGILEIQAGGTLQWSNTAPTLAGAGGAAGAAGAAGTLASASGAFFQRQQGVAGRSSTGTTNGTAATDAGLQVTILEGGPSAPGNGGDGAGGTGGISITQSQDFLIPFCFGQTINAVATNNFTQMQVGRRGAGGSSGATNGTSPGGGGGGGGGAGGGCLIYCREFINAGSVLFPGMDGGAGGSASNANAGGGGGGSGGGGGLVIIYCESFTNTGTIDVSGGTGGAAGAGNGTGTAGTAGADGPDGQLWVYSLTTGEWTVT